MKATAVAGAVALVLAAGACSAASSPAPPLQPAAPAANVAPPPITSAVPGRLAFVSAGQLYVLHRSRGETQARRIALPAGEHAVAPAWSHDRRWLSFLVTRRTSYSAGSVGTLWLARADGRSAHPVLSHVNWPVWSPTDDVLAVNRLARGSAGSGGGWQVRPDRRPRRIPGTAGAVAWSPTGKQLAFTATEQPRRGIFYGLLGTVDADGHHRVVRYRSRENLMILHGWTSDGTSLLAWADAQGSASLAADGLPLLAVSLDTGQAHRVAVTLADPGFVSTSPKTSDIAVAAGRDRELADHKLVKLCQAGGGCTVVPGGKPGPTNLDPALSPADYQLAFVHAAVKPPRTSAPLYAQRSIRAWYRTRSLWLDSYTGGNPQRLRAAGTGVAAPQWSRDGRSILYVRDNALWIIRPGGKRPPRRIAGPLFSGHWPNYYGHIDWADQFAWTG